jgi:orotidine-5'-phosphate decarboxylase
VTGPACKEGSQPALEPLGAVPFGDRLAERVARRQSQIVLGLDPDPMALWPGCAEGVAAEGSAAKRAAAAVEAHCRALLAAAGPACVAVKPQLARFEALGGRGWEVLRTICKEAREQGLLTILDGKRGDIDVSAGAYATALMGEQRTPFGLLKGLKADMITVNPLLGRDALEPFVAAARAAGPALAGPGESESAAAAAEQAGEPRAGRHAAGVLVLVRTSNPGAADVQDLRLAGGGAVWERLAALVAELGEPAVGESGLSDVGAVIGATAPEHLPRARELMPRAVFLLPGVGAQGGEAGRLAPAFAAGRAGGLIAVSRSIAEAHLAAGGGDPASAARAEAERLRALAWSLGG